MYKLLVHEALGGLLPLSLSVSRRSIPRISLTLPARPNTPGKKPTEDFAGFKMDDLRNATDANLTAWRIRMETELRRREQEQKPYTPRGRKRAADEL